MSDCSEEITQDYIRFEEFYNKYKTKKLTNNNMNIEKFQKYYARASFKSNEVNDINNLKTIFYNQFKFIET